MDDQLFCLSRVDHRDSSLMSYKCLVQSLNGGFCHVLEVGVAAYLCSPNSENIPIVTKTLMTRTKVSSALRSGLETGFFFCKEEHTPVKDCSAPVSSASSWAPVPFSLRGLTSSNSPRSMAIRITAFWCGCQLWSAGSHIAKFSLDVSFSQDAAFMLSA